MYLIALAATVMSFLLFKFGVLSVVVSIQAIALKAALALFVVLAVVFTWQRYRTKANN